jgi:hypothetical protein
VNLEEMDARLSIQDLIAKYVQYADTGKAPEQAALFAEDGTLNEHRGRAAIEAFVGGLKTTFAARPGGGGGSLRHHVSSVNITVEGPDTARGTAYYLVVRDHGPDHWGVYRDRYVRVGGRWLFADRQTRRGGTAPGSAAAGLS